MFFFCTTHHPPTPHSNPVACERLVDKGGLRLVFPLFMGKARSKGKRRDDDDDGDADETRSLSLVSCLLQCLHTGGRRERVLAKFVDNEFEKVDRLMELYETYAGRVDDAEDGLVQAAEGGELDEDELLLARMDAGLFALQQVCVGWGDVMDDVCMWVRMVVCVGCWVRMERCACGGCLIQTY